jgi:hypothetical protein
VTSKYHFQKICLLYKHTCSTIPVNIRADIVTEAQFPHRIGILFSNISIYLNQIFNFIDRLTIEVTDVD